MSWGILQLIQKAIPPIIQQSIPSISTTFLTALISTSSVTAIAAFGITEKFEMCIRVLLWSARILLVLVIGFSNRLSRLFVNSKVVLCIVGTYFLIVSVGYILNTVTNCYLGALNGIGKPSKSIFLMIFYYIVVQMPLDYLLYHLGFDLNGI